METNDVETLVKNNIGLVIYRSRKFRFNSLSDSEDFIQAGLIGLLKAARSYNPNLSAFSTYAGRCIDIEILQEIRKNKERASSLQSNVSYSDEESYTDYLPELDEISKTILYMRYIGGYTLREIGEEFGYSKTTAKCTLVRILRAIRDANVE